MQKNYHSPPKLASSRFFVVIPLDPIQSEYKARRQIPHPGLGALGVATPVP